MCDEYFANVISKARFTCGCRPGLKGLGFHIFKAAIKKHNSPGPL